MQGCEALSSLPGITQCDSTYAQQRSLQPPSEEVGLGEGGVVSVAAIEGVDVVVAGVGPVVSLHMHPHEENLLSKTSLRLPDISK